ncbi:MAG: apolipoprotein N-acyltransferase, partial [Gemmatimonadota bacterium]|nr:apolipoprotein N-acyltransferase [Gemmatimonadota bacterium]
GVWTVWKGLPGRRARLRRLGAALAVALLVPLAYSLQRWHSLDLRPAATVGVVQPSVPEHLKVGDIASAADSAMRATESLVRPWRGRRDLDLVLLPETTVQYYLDPIPSRGFEGATGMERWAARLAGSLDADLVIGALGARDLGDGDFVPYNSAFFLRSDGRREGRYDKRYLVPMVERVPFVSPELFAAFPVMSGSFGVGGFQRPLEVAETEASFGVMICYESIFSPLARHYRRAGADFLVNITNDAWFGREVWWSRSSALWQHPAHLVMRAIETRMGAARSANTGISGVVDPLGRFTRSTPLFEPAAFVAQVETTDARTVYVRVGDAAGWAAALAAILALAASLLRRRRRDPRAEAVPDA